MTEQLWAPVAGRYGQLRDGRKVGPMKHCRSGVTTWWIEKNAFPPNHLCWREDGTAWSVSERRLDLVAEWTDSAPAQPIDPFAIRSGDRVRLGGEYDVLGNNGVYVRLVMPGGCADVLAGFIKEHIPSSPRQPTITEGTRVRTRDGMVGTAGKPLKGRVLVDLDGNATPAPFDIAHLTRVDPSWEENVRV